MFLLHAIMGSILKCVIVYVTYEYAIIGIVLLAFVRDILEIHANIESCFATIKSCFTIIKVVDDLFICLT